jgi:DUF971 family protein
MGEQRETTPTPTEIKLRRQSRVLDVAFADGARFELPCEYLRVFSPSAEVQGHGHGEPALVAGKRRVNIERVEPVGSYAVQLTFDDGHNTGIYSWYVLYQLGTRFEENWRRYLERLEAAGQSRERPAPPGAELGITYVDEHGKSQ